MSDTSPLPPPQQPLNIQGIPGERASVNIAYTGTASPPPYFPPSLLTDSAVREARAKLGVEVLGGALALLGKLMLQSWKPQAEQHADRSKIALELERAAACFRGEPYAVKTQQQLAVEAAASQMLEEGKKFLVRIAALEDTAEEDKAAAFSALFQHPFVTLVRKL